MPGLERLDVVVTETVLAGPFHECARRLFPGIEEVTVTRDALSAADDPHLALPPGGDLVHVARDREEEVAAFARRVRQLARDGTLGTLDRAALVIQQPLPYVYVARETLRAAHVPVQTLDALPLAAEPYAAALDLVLSVVAAGFARAPSVALLRSPHFRFEVSGDTISGFDCAALDRALSEAGYLGGFDALEAVVAQWQQDGRGSGSWLGGRAWRSWECRLRWPRSAPRRPGPRTWNGCWRFSTPTSGCPALTIPRGRGSCVPVPRCSAPSNCCAPRRRDSIPGR